MATFPDRVPTKRSVKVASHPVTKRRTVNGRAVRGIKGRFPSDGSMTLEFGGQAGLLDAESAEYWQIWLNARSSTEALILPTSVFSGMSTKLRNSFPEGLQWAFSPTAPRIIPTIPGRSRVEVTLEYRLNSGIL